LLAYAAVVYKERLALRGSTAATPLGSFLHWRLRPAPRGAGRGIVGIKQ